MTILAMATRSSLCAFTSLFLFNAVLSNLSIGVRDLGHTSGEDLGILDWT